MIDPPQQLVNVILRYQCNNVRNGAETENNPEQRIAAFERKPLKGISRRSADEQRTTNVHYTYNQRIAKYGEERKTVIVQYILIIGCDPLQWENIMELDKFLDLQRAFKAGQHRHDKRENP